MFVNTFYSFKGGVGRTMALANVAVHLARRGRRVLVVDFDLEAPGLDTFPALRPDARLPGLVDFVARYLDTNQAPDVREFVGTAPGIDNLQVMPAGTVGRSYAANFARINWRRLYEEREGFLLFEDLKAQWDQALAPDYVLIDSRTGFSDTGGICTRQLPDAVTVLFFPNEQNLRGLAKVVADVRSEQAPPREKTIQLRFVMSNVPDLDDEDEILINMKDRFQQDLAFDHEPLVVHRYDSLSLLNQSVFALDRPRSRLAREYERLADRTVRDNLADPDGAMQFIRDRRPTLQRHAGTDESDAALRTMIRRIEGLHSTNGEVLFRLGQLARRHRLASAESLLDRAVKAGCDTAECHLERARARLASRDEEGASEDASTILASDDLPGHVVLEAVSFLSAQDAVGIDHSPAVMSLASDDQIDLAGTLWRTGKSTTSNAILRRLVEDAELPAEERNQAASALALNYIGSGHCGDAIELLRRDARSVEQMGIQDAFNYGMALWGSSAKVSTPPFERVLELHAASIDRDEGANYWQCLAVASWALGDPEAAIDHVRRAREEADTERRIFSCWRYHEVPRVQFLADTDEVLAMIEGANRKPRFLDGQTELAE